jgi:N-methylhydantoinase B
MGARPNRDGLSATAFPSGIRGVPAEVIEAVAPVLMLKRALRPDSGGPGKFRGGLGQEMILQARTDKPILHSCMYDRTRAPAHGFLGGQPGAPGELFLSDGTRPHPKSKYLLRPDQQLTLRLPGGGGFYSPWERDPAQVLADAWQGLVSLEMARDAYGVVIDPERWRVDDTATETLRQALKSAQAR